MLIALASLWMFHCSRKRNANQKSKMCNFSVDISRFILNFDHKHMPSQLPSSSWRPGGLWLRKTLLHHSCNSCANKTACFNRNNGTARLSRPWPCLLVLYMQQPPLFPMTILTKSVKEMLPSTNCFLQHLLPLSRTWCSCWHTLGREHAFPCHAIFWANLYC